MNTFHFKENGKIVLELVAERLRGETAIVDIKLPDGTLLVEAGRSITARHIRQMVEAKVTELRSKN